MNRTYTLIIAIVLFAGLSVVLSMAYSSNKAKQAGQLASLVATSEQTLGSTTSKKAGTATPTDSQQPRPYINQNVRFSSPQLLVKNVDSDHQFILSSTVNGKSSFVEVFIEKRGDCFHNYCKAETLRTETHNNLSFEFLGNPEYCDAKECSQPSALYRTRTASKDIYLIFYEYGPALNKDAIFSMFTLQ